MRIFFFDLGLSIYFFYFNLFLTSHKYSEAQLGLVTAAMAAGNLAGALPAGRLIQRAGLRSALITCLVVAPGMLCARCFWLAFPIQIGLAFASGLGMSLWAVCISPMIASITGERERPVAFSLVFSLGIGIGALGALAGSRMPNWFSLVPGLASWLAPDQLTLIAGCCLAALGLVPALALRNVTGPLPLRPRLSSSPMLKRFLIAAAVWGLVTGSFSPFASVYLAAHLHLPLQSIGTVFSLSQFFQVAAVLCAPLLFRRFGVGTGVFATQIATASCFIVLAMSSHSASACITYVTLTAAQYMSEPGIYSLMMEIVPDELRAGASAFMTLMVAASQLIAATLAGWAFTNLGYPRALVIIAMVAVVASLLFKTAIHADSRRLIRCAPESQAP